MGLSENDLFLLPNYPYSLSPHSNIAPTLVNAIQWFNPHYIYLILTCSYLPSTSILKLDNPSIFTMSLTCLPNPAPNYPLILCPHPNTSVSWDYLLVVTNNENSLPAAASVTLLLESINDDILTGLYIAITGSATLENSYIWDNCI